MTNLDETDRKIIATLTNYGRASYTAIAAAVGLSVSAACERVKKLQERGVITGYTATIDPGAVGLDVAAFVQVTAPTQTRGDFTGITGVGAVHRVADARGDGYLIHVHAENLAALNATIATIADRAGATPRTVVVLQEDNDTRGLPLPIEVPW